MGLPITTYGRTNTVKTSESKVDLSKIFLNKLGLSKKCYLALNRANIWNVEDLSKLSRSDLLSISRIGDTAISEIETALVKNNLYDRTRLSGAKMEVTPKRVEYVEIGYKVPIKRTFNIYTWIYLENGEEKTADFNRYKKAVTDEFRKRFNIPETDIVNIVWNEYLPVSMTGYPIVEAPKFADIRLFGLSKSLERMSQCSCYAIIHGGKMQLPTQIQLELNCWMNSFRKPEFRSPIILHKDNI